VITTVYIVRTLYACLTIAIRFLSLLVFPFQLQFDSIVPSTKAWKTRHIPALLMELTGHWPPECIAFYWIYWTQCWRSSFEISSKRGFYLNLKCVVIVCLAGREPPNHRTVVSFARRDLHNFIFTFSLC